MHACILAFAHVVLWQNQELPLTAQDGALTFGAFRLCHTDGWFVQCMVSAISRIVARTFILAAAVYAGDTIFK